MSQHRLRLDRIKPKKPFATAVWHIMKAMVQPLKKLCARNVNVENSSPLLNDDEDKGTYSESDDSSTPFIASINQGAYASSTASIESKSG